MSYDFEMYNNGEPFDKLFFENLSEVVNMVL